MRNNIPLPPFFKKPWGKVILHSALAVTGGLLLLLIFFYVYLPLATNHGETITTPDIYGIHIDDLDEFLTKRNLRYEVTPDSGYSSELPPYTVLQQYPEAGSKVKENRKIYISLNAKNPPKIKMPKLVDGSLKNAEIVLKSYGLILGNIQYVPDLAENAVLEQLNEGEKIKPGAYIPKGSVIDLVVGDGYGRATFNVSSFTNMPFDEAKVAILGSNLKLGQIYSVDAPESETGKVVKQYPKSGKEVNIGESVDLWVANYDAYTDQ